MAEVETTYEHIILTEDGTPVIEGANTKVIEVVLPVRASPSVREPALSGRPRQTSN